MTYGRMRKLTQMLSTYIESLALQAVNINLFWVPIGHNTLIRIGRCDNFAFSETRSKLILISPDIH